MRVERPASGRRTPYISAARALVAAALIGTALVGCANYSFSSAVTTHISTIAIPVLENETLEYGAEQDVTRALIDEFTEENALRVVSEEEADSILRGAVVLYERPVMSYDAAGNPNEYKVRVVARLAYEDLTRNEIVWEGEVEGWGVYSVTGAGGALTSEEEARDYAFEKLAEDVSARTVQSW